MWFAMMKLIYQEMFVIIHFEISYQIVYFQNN
jgi:hypothetical protein